MAEVLLALEAEELAAKLIHASVEWAGGQDQADDMTVLVLRAL